MATKLHARAFELVALFYACKQVNGAFSDAQALTDVKAKLAAADAWLKANAADDRAWIVAQATIDTENAAENQQRADAVYYSNTANTAIAGGMTKVQAADAAYNGDADAARKARWTQATVRALFGL